MDIMSFYSQFNYNCINTDIEYIEFSSEKVTSGTCGERQQFTSTTTTEVKNVVKFAPVISFFFQFLVFFFSFYFLVDNDGDWWMLVTLQIA